MATRRIVSSDKGVLDVDQNGSSIAATEKSDITPAVPAPVIYKLLAFTAAMVIVPIGSYFATVDTVFGGNSTYAGATAAVLANVVLIGYVFVAIAEDKSDQQAAAKKGKKAQ